MDTFVLRSDENGRLSFDFCGVRWMVLKNHESKSLFDSIDIAKHIDSCYQ